MIAAGGLTGCGDEDQPPAPPPPPTATGALAVTSEAFTEGATIPPDFTCGGAGKAPPLTIKSDETALLALVVDDPDAPGGTYVHWVVFDLPSTTTVLTADALPIGARQGANSAGGVGWTPPCPPSGTHHYRFTLYALKAPLGLRIGVPAAEAQQAIAAASVAQARLVGTVAAN